MGDRVLSGTVFSDAGTLQLREPAGAFGDPDSEDLHSQTARHPAAANQSNALHTTASLS